MTGKSHVPDRWLAIASTITRPFTITKFFEIYTYYNEYFYKCRNNNKKYVQDAYLNVRREKMFGEQGKEEQDTTKQDEVDLRSAQLQLVTILRGLRYYGSSGSGRVSVADGTKDWGSRYGRWCGWRWARIRLRIITTHISSTQRRWSRGISCMTFFDIYKQQGAGIDIRGIWGQFDW